MSSASFSLKKPNLALIFCTAASLGVMATTGVTADEAGDSRDIPAVPLLDDARAVFEGQLESLQKVSRLEYEMKRDLIVGPKAGTFSVRYKLVDSIDGKFLCDWLQTQSNGDHLEQAAAFDGKTYQNLDRESGTLSVVEGLPVQSSRRMELSAEEFALTPFSYACSGRAEKSSIGSPSISVLGSAETYKRLLRMVARVEFVQVAGEDCLKVALEGLKGREDEDVNRTIIFRKSDGLPVMWEDATPEGVLMSRYTVEDWGQAWDRDKSFSIPYPKLAKREFFLPSSGSEPSVAYKYQIGDCTINDGVPSDFTFDFSSVEGIYDHSNEVMISVPK